MVLVNKRKYLRKECPRSNGNKREYLSISLSGFHDLVSVFQYLHYHWRPYKSSGWPNCRVVCSTIRDANFYHNLLKIFTLKNFVHTEKQRGGVLNLHIPIIQLLQKIWDFYSLSSTLFLLTYSDISKISCHFMLTLFSVHLHKRGCCLSLPQ